MNTTSTSMPRWTLAFAAAAVALSLVSLSYRYRVEQRNRAVALAAEADAVESLGASQQLDFRAALKALKGKGINAVVLNEETVGDLVSTGTLALQPDLGQPKSEGKWTTVAPGVIACGERPVLQRVLRGIDIRYPSATQLSPALIRGVPVGLDPDHARAIRELGMTVIARCNNTAGIRASAVKRTLEWARELGATVFLPMGDQVLGRREAMTELIDELRARKMLYASPEFAKIGGDAKVLEKAPDIVVRLHAAQAAEVDKMTEQEVIERYVLAGSERDVRILLLRPLSLSGGAPLDDFGELTSKIGKQIKREGGEIKAARPYEEPNVPTPVFPLIALCIAVAAAGVLFGFTGSQPMRMGGSVVFLLIAAASVDPRFRPFAALLGAATFPILAFLILGNGVTKNVVVEFLIVSLVSVGGGLCVAGMLNAAPYFIRADQFFGVKAAQFFPIAVVCAFYFTRLCETEGAGKNPVLWGQVLLAFVILAALGLLWMRSGNDNPAAVSGIELKMRSLLTRYLAVRPRTKELFIGHPLMIVGTAMLLKARLSAVAKPKDGGWIALALTAGAVGQTGIVNTLCHLHTPLTVGLMRITVGIVLGGILGLILWAIVSKLSTERGG